MKKLIAVILFCLCAAAFSYILFIKHQFHKDVKINDQVSVILREISTPKRIARWYLPFAKKDSTQFRIIERNRLQSGNSALSITALVGFTADYDFTENKKKEQFEISILPDTGRFAKVSLYYRNTYWNEFFNSNANILNAKRSLDNLKEYMEDTKKMYGFEIEMTTVTDTSFLFTSRIVPNKDKKNTLGALYSSLIEYAQSKDLGYNGVRIFYSLPYGKDSTHLFTSIGISNTQNAPITGDIVLKRMPYMGKLLKAYYQGSFGNATSALNALDQFKTDNEMNSMAIPFIKLITDGTSFDDSQIIQAIALYPVY